MEGKSSCSYRRNRFLFQIDGVDIPEFAVSEVAFKDGLIAVIYREAPMCFTSEYFVNHMNEITQSRASIRLIDENGITIGKIEFTGVSFHKMELASFAYDCDKPLTNTVYYTYEKVGYSSL